MNITSSETNLANMGGGALVFTLVGLVVCTFAGAFVLFQLNRRRGRADAIFSIQIDQSVSVSDLVMFCFNLYLDDIFTFQSFATSEIFSMQINEAFTILPPPIFLIKVSPNQYERPDPLNMDWDKEGNPQI